MEIFDIKKFNQNKGDDETYVFERKDGARVYQFGDEESGYFEYTRAKNDLFEDRKAYYPDGILKVNGSMYYNEFQKGVWTYFDPSGKLDRTINYDEAFSYSWEDVLEYCEDKKIDLWSNTTRISRNLDDGSPKWIIEWQVGTAKSIEVTLNGQSGELMDTQTIELDKG